MQDYYNLPMLLSLAFTLLGWTVAYVVIIRRSIADGVCGMPLVPLCINLSWEFVFAFVHPDKAPANYVCMAYFALDLGIVYALLRHGRAGWPALLPRWTMVPGFLAVLALSFSGLLAVTYQLQDWTGSYTGWGDNLLIFCALLAMLLRRQDTRGQSLWIAGPAWLGSVCQVPMELMLSPGNLLLGFFYLGFIVVGPVYLVLLHRQFVKEGKNPWTVF